MKPGISYYCCHRCKIKGELIYGRQVPALVSKHKNPNSALVLKKRVFGYPGLSSARRTTQQWTSYGKAFLKRITPLYSDLRLDIVKIFGIDIMHALHGGALRNGVCHALAIELPWHRLLTLRQSPQFIVDIFDKTLESLGMCSPCEICRKPRKVSFIGKWKMRECYTSSAIFLPTFMHLPNVKTLINLDLFQNLLRLILASRLVATAFFFFKQISDPM